MKKIFLLLILYPFILSASTKLIVLGSGTPNPDPARNGSAYAVIVNNQAYLVDFGPGDDAGLKPGDIILKFNGQLVDEPGSLAWWIAKTRPGTSVRLDIARGHGRKTVSLVVVSASDG